jgi:hypothetical protein
MVPQAEGWTSKGEEVQLFILRRYLLLHQVSMHGMERVELPSAPAKLLGLRCSNGTDVLS